MYNVVRRICIKTYLYFWMFYWVNKNFLFFVHRRTSLRVHVTCFLHFNSNHHVTFPAILHVQSLDVVTFSFLQKEIRWLLFGWSRPACWWLKTGCDFRLENKKNENVGLTIFRFQTHTSNSNFWVNHFSKSTLFQYIFRFISLIDQRNKRKMLRRTRQTTIIYIAALIYKRATYLESRRFIHTQVQLCLIIGLNVERVVVVRRRNEEASEAIAEWSWFSKRGLGWRACLG